MTSGRENHEKLFLFAALAVALAVTVALAAVQLPVPPETPGEARAAELPDEPENAEPADVPGEAAGEPPENGARAWALADSHSGEYLAGENASEELPMASTTKIMLALLVLETADLDEEVTVSEEAAAYADPLYSNVGLFAGDRLSVRELLLASLLASGSDASYALAGHLGGGSTGRFVDMMNERAAELGLRNTRFENPVGNDAPGHYSTARDLAALAAEALSRPEFREMVGTGSAVISTGDRQIPLESTNALLGSYPLATGVKTGTTPEAGESLVASAASGEESYVAVFLDAEDRFAAAEAALEYGFAAYDREPAVSEGGRYAETPVPYRRGESVELVAERGVDVLFGAGGEVERQVRLPEELPAEAGPGTRVGEVVVTVDGEQRGESPLVTLDGYTEASLWEKLWYTAGGIFNREE
ncbi:MAG: D-alanyl-D-alanine carboxypeptidase [Rubrobacter sp.]|nr:D-alanyl-D-alanine carboxypeptidase [Rubrobacter sp.]